MLKRSLRFALFFAALAGIILYGSCRNRHLASKNKKGNADTLANFPYWIGLMDSPGVNYEFAVNAFNKYWEHRERPTEADGEGQDIYGNREKDKDKGTHTSIQYVYEYKQFLNWQQRNKNLVKPDGTVMTPEELLEQWRKIQIDTITR